MIARGRGDPWILAAALLALYAASAPRGVMMEDDGNFVLASHFLGIAHPPGYPLHTLLGKVFTLLPFGSIAWRVHLLSAACGALSCAALWLCARALLPGRLPAAAAALALGLTPVFWSQAVIAEVYTLNTLFFFALLALALRGGPLPAMALLYGLSLANHWPLMLLASPALALLLWPRRAEILRRAPLLAALFAAGLAPPYAWMAARSHAELAVSFAGPLGTLQEFWFFVSRAGYAQVDASATAGGLDRLRYLRWFGGQLFLQLAVAGTLAAALGFRLQWAAWGTRVATALTLAFVLNSVGLILLLGFDFDALYKHIFHVYLLPAYGIAALWLALGVSWLAQRRGPQTAAAATAATLVLIGALGLYANRPAESTWAERYARALLAALPPGAVVLVKGADVGLLAYLHMVEGARPDITLVQPEGLVLGNRLFHPYRVAPGAQEAAVRALVERTRGPVATTAPPLGGIPWREQWLFATREAADSTEIPPSLRKFFDEELRDRRERNAFVAFYQGELRRRYAALSARSGADLRRLPEDFESSLGAAEGLMASAREYPLREAARLLENAAARMPADASKPQQARLLELRGYVRFAAGDRRGAIGDLELAQALWPSPANGAAAALKRLTQAP